MNIIEKYVDLIQIPYTGNALNINIDFNKYNKNLALAFQDFGNEILNRFILERKINSSYKDTITNLSKIKEQLRKELNDEWCGTS